MLSGNRNFEGRMHPEVKMNFLASPPLVVAYALAGTMNIDLTKEPLGTGKDGKPVYLKDIWPTLEGDPRSHRDARRLGDVQARATRSVFDGDEQLERHHSRRPARSTPGTTTRRT